MDPNLQQALAATRAGEVKEAQVILSQHLIESPSDPDGWYFLSQLVESEEREKLYLTKAVELQPQHNHATSRLAALGVSAAAIGAAAKLRSDEPENILELPETPAVEEDIPAWLSDDAKVSAEVEEDSHVDEIAAFAASAVVASEAELPDWLRDLETDEEEVVVAERAETVPSAELEEPTADVQPVVETPSPTPKAKNKGDVWLTRILILLVIIAIIVLAYLLYLVFWV